MASLNPYLQFETNLVSNRKVIELLLQLQGAKAHGKKCIKVKPYLVRHLLRSCLFAIYRVLHPKQEKNFEVFSHLGFDIQRNSDYETHKIKL